MENSRISLIIGREFGERTSRKSFWVMTILTPLVTMALIVVPIVIGILSASDSSVMDIVVVDNTDGSQVLSRLVSDEHAFFIPSEGAGYPEVSEKWPDVLGYMVIPRGAITDSRSSVEIYLNQPSTLILEDNIRNRVEDAVQKIRIERSGVENLERIIAEIRPEITIRPYEIRESGHGDREEHVSSAKVSAAVSYAAAFIIYMFVLMYGNQVMAGVVEEKQNRVLELVVSSVKPFQLMMGKILGIAAVALMQLMMWVAILSAGFLTVQLFFVDTPDGSALQALPEGYQGALQMLSDTAMMLRIGGTFFLMFIGGYLLYASMYAAIGSAVSSIQDTQQLNLPVTVPLIVAFVVTMSAMVNPGSQLAFWCSMIPFTSPVVMMARITYGVPVWQWILSVVLLYGTFAAVTWASGRIYRVGIFMYGKKPTLREMLRWINYS